MKSIIQEERLKEEGTVPSIFAQKFKICLNLIKIHICHLEHVCI